MSQAVDAEDDLDVAFPEAPGASHLPAAIHRLLVSACDAAALLTLELEVAGRPELRTSVRAPSAAPEEIDVWLTRRPRSRWSNGLVVTASAAVADPRRRAVLEHTTTVIAELVDAHARAGQAETLARRALRLAGVDPLTELGNRRTWKRALDDEERRAARYGTPTTIVVVDLNGLKRMNDEDGHAAGDAYLQRVAGAVRAAARSVDVVCRLGGDEFGLLAPQTDTEGAARLRDRLRATLVTAEVDASIGVATAADGRLDDAWQSADAAMYEDKRSRAVR